MGNKFNQIIDPNAGSIMDHFEGLEDRHRSGWDDMPEFVQQNKESFHRIVVRFNSEEDVIRAMLHEYTHATQDPKKIKQGREKGYTNNPMEKQARNAEKNWKKYL